MTFIFLMILCFILLMAIRIPIPFALLASTLVYFIGADIPLSIMVVRLFRSFDSFVLLAIPFFILAGKVMAESGISDRIIRLADLIVGRVKGNLAYVNIVVSMFFGGITGTAISDTTAVGSVMIPAMTKAGYKKSFSAAVTAASSTMGPIIPPSLMFILYGSIAQVSIKDMFLAGAIPGVMVGLAQIIVVWLYGRKNDLPRREEKITRKQGFDIVGGAFYAMLLPVIILGGILMGIVSPTEAAVIAVFYAIFIAIFVYRSLTWKRLMGAIRESTVETGSVSIIIAAAGIFGWALSNEQLPMIFAEYLVENIESTWLILLLINVLLFFLGMFMDSIPALMIVTPVLLPVFDMLGIDPLHAGIFMCVNLITGLATPPVGCCLFASSIISGESMEKISRAILPFILANVIIVLLITYIPWITLFLPSLFN
ncbi:TRAP transporter large permease [uncultured Psychromonas sp.]|jgi:tripartite ATP-independent transporter DctM subunit|uniref:TRAP transporter large permease n=1 Tax=uncultured Psychromonas sp. TaxID=173974 RepID=UPI00261F76AF|nr:TRAP transporter large permease [uncultured Psychromonas sp.]